MNHTSAKRSQKAGLPPGTLMLIGERKTDTVNITACRYNAGIFEEKTIHDIDEWCSEPGDSSVVWINVDGIHNVDLIGKIGTRYELHPLVLEDILNTDQRPKIENLGDYLCIITKTLLPVSGSPGIRIGQISIIAMKNVVLTFQEGGNGGIFNAVRERLRTVKGKIRAQGADYLAYCLIDSIVDSYFLVIETLAGRIEFIEEQLIGSPTRKTLFGLHEMKRDLIFARKSVWPLREVIASIERGDSPVITDTTKFYLRDVYDHVIHINDTLETYRDMLSGMLDLYVSSVTYRTNEIMKVLAIIATIFMPLTFIAGVYGMNFENMPELKWPFGYPLVLSVMCMVGTGMLVYFRKRKWL